MSQIPWETVRAILFDLDGTLMDTDDQAVDSLARKLRFLGADRAHRLARRVVMWSETPMNNLITLFDVVGLDPLLFAARRLLRRPTAPTFRLIAGVSQLLASLADRYRLGIVTTRSAADAEAFLQQHHLTSYFQVLVTQTSTYRLKPSPEPILFAAQQLSLTPQSCVMVGDTPVDILAARRAGAWAVGVLCGFGEADELRRAGAQCVLPSTAALRAC